MVDLIGEGFDAAFRIADLPDSSLVARRLCDMPPIWSAPRLSGQAWPAEASARPRAAPLHHLQLFHDAAETWRFTKTADPRRCGRRVRSVNNGDAMMPALIAGTGLGMLPEFIVRDALAAGRLERLLPGWSLPPGRGLLGDAAGGTSAQTGRGPRRFSDRETRPAYEARSESSACRACRDRQAKPSGHEVSVLTALDVA